MTEPGRRPRLRVGLVVSTPQRRGAEVFAVGLAERLRERDWGVEVASIDRSDTANLLEEIAPLGDGRRSVAMWRNLVRLARRCDVLVASGGTTLLPVAAIARITATPYVYRNIGDPSAWGNVRGADLRLGLPLRSAAGVIALYGGAGDDLQRRYRLDARRITVAPNAASSNEFSPPTEAEHCEARAALGLEVDQPVVVYLGALSEEKNPLLAIKAVLAEPTLRLLVVGDGPLREKCDALAASAPDRVRVLGTRNDVPAVLAAADALVISSHTEGIAGAAIEAGLSGVPVVTTDVGGMAELVLDGVTGLVLDRPDAATLGRALVTAAGHRDPWGAAAVEHCRAHYEFDAVTDLWVEALQAAADRRFPNPEAMGS